jgi:hypothetical protein
MRGPTVRSWPQKPDLLFLKCAKNIVRYRKFAERKHSHFDIKFVLRSERQIPVVHSKAYDSA